MGVECSMPVHKDSYLVKVTCPVKELKSGTQVNVQLYNKDTFRLDDVIALGTVEYKDNPTEATVGRAKIKLLYNKLPAAQP